MSPNVSNFVERKGTFVSVLLQHRYDAFMWTWGNCLGLPNSQENALKCGSFPTILGQTTYTREYPSYDHPIPRFCTVNP